MTIVTDNHAETKRRPGSAETAEALLLDTVGEGLRALYSDPAADMPDAWIALALRLDMPVEGLTPAD